MTPTRKHVRLTRDAALILFGVGLVTSQVISWFTIREVEASLVTAGTSIALSPLLLRRDEKD